MRTTLPRRLDPDAIEQAPSLEDSPLDAAVLAVGTNPAPYSVEGVAVMSPRGAWRVIDRYRLGMRDPDIVEQQYSLSPDGRTLALGDAHGIVLVDIRTAGAVRVPVEANDLVLHAWTPNGSHLIFTPRSDATKTLLLDVADRTVTRAGFRAWASSVGPAGQIAELLPRATSPRPTHTALRILEAGNETVTAPLGVQLSREPRIGRQWSSVLTVAQERLKRSPIKPARGVLALDPHSGQAVGLLALGRGQMTWTSMPGVATGGWVLLSVAHGPGGGIVAWDPVAKRLRGVMAIDEPGYSVRIARRVLERARR